MPLIDTTLCASICVCHESHGAKSCQSHKAMIPQAGLISPRTQICRGLSCKVSMGLLLVCGDSIFFIRDPSQNISRPQRDTSREWIKGPFLSKHKKARRRIFLRRKRNKCAAAQKKAAPAQHCGATAPAQKKLGGRVIRNPISAIIAQVRWPFLLTSSSDCIDQDIVRTRSIPRVGRCPICR